MANRGISTTFMTSFGAGLEYYDFIIYALLTPFIGANYFLSSSPVMTTINTFCVFAAGYLVRPLGGMIFGYFGDKYGRKKTLISAMLLMASSTLLMGILPTVHSAGYFIAVVFLICRLLQGISFGAELPCSITFISEHAERNSRGFSCGILSSFITIGVLLGTFVIFVISTLLTSEQMNDWGWRLPFILGGIIAVAAYSIRTKTAETPYFKKSARSSDNNPLYILFRENYKNLLKGVGIMLFPASFVLFLLTIPALLINQMGRKPSEVYLMMTVSYLFTIFILPFFGWLSDCVGRRKLLMIVVFLFIIFCSFFFNMLYAEGSFSLLLFLLIYQLIISAMAGCYYPLLAELFPTNVRFSGVAVVYNFTFALASFIPVAVTGLFYHFKSALSISLLFMLLAGLTLISSFFINEYAQKKLD